jgi:hypothetical protein
MTKSAKPQAAALTRWWWLLGVLAVAGGCSRQDTDVLARIGRKTAARSEVVTAGVHKTVHRGCQGVWSSWDAAALETRVAARLRWEKGLNESAIEVRATGTTVELHGKVRDEGSRKRAGELAETTLGVEKVENRLELGKEAPAADERR